MTLHQSLQPSPVDELRAACDVPFARARAMPKSVYASPEFADLEARTIFARDWICAGRASALPNPGDYLTMVLAGEPIVVLRDQQGTLRAMSNVCRHRMSVLLEGRGNTRTIVCPYHAWTYGLDGCLRGAPAMGKNETFARGDIALPQIRCVDWQGWIMVTLDPDAPDPRAALAGIDALVGAYDMASYVEAFREEFRWHTNWKVLAENFMESYHLPVCHSGTIGGFVSLEKMTCPEGFDAFNYHWILKKDDAPLTVAHPSNTVLQGEERVKTWLLSIYPALMITLTPGYFWYLSLHPDGPDHVKILYGGGLHADYANDPEAHKHFAALKTLLDAVNDEDRGCTEKVFKGLLGRMAEPGALSHLERPNYEFAQYISSKVGG